MPEREVTIVNKLGLHARAAAKLVTLATQYPCEVRVARAGANGREVSGKSIMGVMMLAAGQGSRIRLIAEGEGAEQALSALADLINRRFDEEA
ncbi:MAG TPA: HPr family phosphocarrier protein [Nevskiales bacterium]|nr:HPr family phosphocarrier protein [Nevskiales bacterium]